ncbi:MAG: hypothetical protein MJ123_00090 [Lachnospiraceae bacterium]|nr:hypothetical protein [Lachnospiraceae bacterium]
MDYRLKRQVIAIVSFLILGILVIVFVANWRTVKRKLPSTSSVSEAGVEDTSVTEPENPRTVLIGDNPTKWKSDDSFFDGGEIISTAEAVSNDMRTLSVNVVSVFEDLRISIYGYGKVLHTGEEFKVHLKNLDNPTEIIELTDSDKDGILYIDNLLPAEYTVALQPIGGFVVPSNSSRVLVKGRLETKKIPDIELIINEKQGILKKVEDTRTYTESEEKSDDMYEELDAIEYATYGMEVSCHDEDVDFDTLYEEGLRFVMLRAGYRGARTGKIYIDPSFVDYVSMAKRAGLEIGAYFFSQAVNEKEAVEEASALLKMCEDMYITYPMALAIDSAGGDGRADTLSADERTAICASFAETIKSEGFDTLIYGSSKWLEDKVNVSKLEKYGIWVGDLNPVPLYEKVYDFWEYSDEGFLRGYDGDARLIIDMRK